MLLLHGFDSSVLEFRYLLPLLAKSYRVQAIDLLGFGFSDRFLQLKYDPASIEAHLYAYWQTCIGEPMVLVGASLGGGIALRFALTHPECISKLVLICSIGFSGSIGASWLFPPLEWVALEWWRQRKLQALFWGERTGVDAQTLEAIRCASLHLEMPYWGDALIAFTKSEGYADLANKIACIEIPTLILWGERDGVLGTSIAWKFPSAIARSRLVWLEAGHVPHVECPQRVAEEIFRFCGSVDNL